ncbi:hypothetical protein FRC03_008274 [Tulasnella sp. 419]|nr:hypothetical protein FRC03_008274 [Tulasnella sp. 419]
MPQPLRLFYNETPNLTSLQFYPLSPMESLHLPFAIALASISASSLGLLGFSWFRSRSRDSKVSLPTAADEPLSTSHEVNDDAEVDPFDVTKPEDFVDGFALEEDAFWAKMRLRKMGISLVLAIIVAANGALLGWLLAAGKDTKAAYQATFLELFASIYILVISLISIFQTEVKPHWNLTVHLTTLSSISFFLFATRIVLPGPHHKAFHLSLQSSTIRTCGYLNAVPYLLVAFLAGTARRSPDLHYPPELAYSSEVAHQEGFPASNVCGIVTKSLFSFIFFDYITPVVFRGYGRSPFATLT